MTPERERTRLQQMLAETGDALNQCIECGSYRSDGKPPVLHEAGCSHTDDWKADPLYIFR